MTAINLEVDNKTKSTDHIRHRILPLLAIAIIQLLKFSFKNEDNVDT